jgi:hypothetical protein
MTSGPFLPAENAATVRGTADRAAVAVLAEASDAVV